MLYVENVLLYELAGLLPHYEQILQKAREQKPDRPIWLIGENYGLSARDNSFAFFEWCMRQNLEQQIYYVVKPDSPEIKRLAPYMNHVLMYDSDEHIYIDFLCELYIVSHGVRDVMPSLYHKDLGVCKKHIIYLQHGITAMKKMGMSNRSYGGMIKRFVVSSTQEKQLLRDAQQFISEELIVTGLARYDKLVQADPPQKIIWVMPTWRDYLTTSLSGFKTSTFYRQYTDLLGNPDLLSALRENNFKLYFNLHIEFEKFRSFFEPFENDVIHITDMHEIDISDLVRRCAMIVTDYSSVAFDVLYLKKPAVFFQFDRRKYGADRGSYVDLDKDLPGRVTRTSEETAEAICLYLNNGFGIEPAFEERRKKYFDFEDVNNSERIYREIIRYQTLEATGNNE